MFEVFNWAGKKQVKALEERVGKLEAALAALLEPLRGRISPTLFLPLMDWAGLAGHRLANPTVQLHQIDYPFLVPVSVQDILQTLFDDLGYKLVPGKEATKATIAKTDEVVKK